MNHLEAAVQLHDQRVLDRTRQIYRSKIEKLKIYILTDEDMVNHGDNVLGRNHELLIHQASEVDQLHIL